MAEKTRFGFTKTKLAALPAPKAGRSVYYDTQTPGLILRITDNDRRSFYFYRKVKGRPMRLFLGGFPETSVDKARKACQTTSGDVAQGKDPQAERRAARHEQTVAGLFGYWLENARQRKKTWNEDQRQYTRFLTPWANRRLSSIRKSDVQSLFTRVGSENGRYAANRLLALVRAMFNRAPDMGFTGPNPTIGVKKFSEEKRDRFLHAEEMKAFFGALAAEPNDVLRDLLTVALLTGARKANVCGMRWDELDFDTALWRIPTTKAGRPQVVPLVNALVRLLQIRRKAMNGSPWVFPGRGKTGHITEVKSAWKRIVGAANLADCRPHDLRRTLASYMAIGGTSLPIVGAMLGHSQPSTTAIYARLSVDPLRIAAESATAAIYEAGGVKLLDVQPQKGGKNDA
jgi:integrase